MSLPDKAAAVRASAVRCAVSWSVGFFAVARGWCTDRALKSFAVLQRQRRLAVMDG